MLVEMQRENKFLVAKSIITLPISVHLASSQSQLISGEAVQAGYQWCFDLQF